MATRHNDRLPFDVIAPIFEYYVEEDTMEYSLDTLLLVCRTWKDSGLAHHTLWGNINVVLKRDDNLGLRLFHLSTY